MDKLIDFLTIVFALVFANIAGFAVAAKGLDMMGAAGQRIKGAFDKAGAGGQGMLGKRKETNAFAIRRQLKAADKQEQRTLRAAGQVSGGIGPSWLNSRTRKVLPRRMQARGERVRAKAQSYALKQEMEGLTGISDEHMQALAMSGGNVGQAVDALVKNGRIDDTTGARTKAESDLKGTLSALRSRGTDLGSNTTRQAIGELGAEHGTYLEGYGNWFSGEAEKKFGGGSYAAALAEGTAGQWGRTARSKGQMSHSPDRVGSFTQVGAADLSVYNRRVAQKIETGLRATASAKEQAEAKSLIDQMGQLHAQADIAIAAGDASYDHKRREDIAAGRAQLDALLTSHGASFNTVVGNKRTEMERPENDRSRTSL